MCKGKFVFSVMQDAVQCFLHDSVFVQNRERLLALGETLRVQQHIPSDSAQAAFEHSSVSFEFKQETEVKGIKK